VSGSGQILPEDDAAHLHNLHNIYDFRAAQTRLTRQLYTEEVQARFNRLERLVELLGPGDPVLLSEVIQAINDGEFQLASQLLEPRNDAEYIRYLLGLTD